MSIKVTNPFLTGSGTTNTITKWTGGMILGNSLLTDDGTTFAINVNKFTVTEANGNTAVAGTLGVTGLSTLTGGFSAGAQSDMTTHKIVNLSNGTNPNDAINLSQLTGAVSGTVGTYAMFTGTNVVGNSTFPISESSATALSIGDSTTLDQTTINGFGYLNTTAAVTAVPTFQGGLPASLAVAHQGSQWGITVVRATANASGANLVLAHTRNTDPTVATALQNNDLIGGLGFHGPDTDNVYQIGATIVGVVDAAPGSGSLPTKLAFSTGTGTPVTRMSISSAGDIVIGNATTQSHTVSGRITLTSTTAAQIALNSTYSATGSTTTDMSGIRGSNSATYDTTASGLTARGITASVSASRSAGANNLTNLALYATAINGQVNRALVTDDGNVILNNLSGTTTIGFSQATTNALVVSGASTITSTNASVNALVATTNATGATTSLTGLRGTNTSTFDTTSAPLEVYSIRGVNTASRSAGANTLTVVGMDGEASGGQNNYGLIGRTTGTGTTNAGLLATATGAGTTNIGVDTTATGAGTNIALRTTDGDNYFNTTSGSSAFGVASGTSLSAKVRVDGRVAITSTVSTTHGLVVTENFAGGTTSSVAGIRVDNTSTLDTTAGVLNTIGVSSVLTATRSAGGNNLTNIALFGTATGAQVNEALRTDDGNVVLNRVSGTTTIGFSNGTSSALTVKGQTGFTSSLATASANTFTWTPVAGTTSGLGAVDALTNGTMDTTAIGKNNFAVRGTATMTRSAGANNVVNIGVYGTASGGQDNRAFQSDDGNNYFNNLSGNTGIGVPVSASISQKLRVDVASGGTGILSLNNKAGQTNDSQSLALLQNTGTYDTTAAGLTAFGLNVLITATRSAGANGLTNTACLLSASGGQSNRALQTQDGGVVLNAVSGTTSIGFSQGTASALTLNGTAAFNSTNTANNGLTMAWTPSSGTTSSLAGIRASVTGTFDASAGNISSYGMRSVISTSKSAGANTLTNIALYGTATSADTNVALKTDDGSVQLNVVSGVATMGFSQATTNALTVSGSTTINATGTNSAFTGNYQATGSTTSNLNAVRGSNSATYDTTAGALTAVGVNGACSASRSAGANNLTCTGGLFTAINGQVNRALQTNDGDVLMNVLSGNTTIGAGSATTSTLAFNGQAMTITSAPAALTATSNALTIARTGTWDTTGGVLTSRGANISATSTRSAGANNLQNFALELTASGAQVNQALRTGDGDVKLNVISGTTAIGFSNATASALTVSGQSAFTSALSTGDGLTSTWTPVAGTTSGLAAINATSNGTIDTTAGSLSSTAIRAFNTATRSAGGNNLTNIGMRANASGAQINIAFQSDAGDNYLNTASGNTGIGYAGGTALPAKLSVTGTTYVSSDLTVDGNTVAKGAANPLTVTVPTDGYVLQYKRLTLTSTNRLTLSGTAEVFLDDFDAFTEAWQTQSNGQQIIGTSYIPTVDLLLQPDSFVIQYKRLTLDKTRRLTTQGTSDFILTDFTQPTGRAVLQGQF